MKVFDWNGRDVPEVLKGLPPGQYVLQPVEELIALDTDDEHTLRTGLAQLERGEWISHDDVLKQARQLPHP